MIKVSRLSHATFETPDLQKAIDYFTQVNGLALIEHDGRRVFLGAKTGLLSIQLEQGHAAGCRSLAFELGEGADLGSIRRRLSDEGIASEERRDCAPGVSSMLALCDPNGTRIELCSGTSYIGSGFDVTGVGPLKLGHVAFFST